MAANLKVISAFGQGWEAKRAGTALGCNPFPLNTWKWACWKEGWLSFAASREPSSEKQSSKSVLRR